MAWQFYFSRWIAMLGAIAGIALALAIAPTSVELLFFAATVPAALQGIGTITVDTLTLPAALCLTSLIRRLALAPASEKRRAEGIAVLALTILLSVGKSPYGLLGMWGAYVLWRRNKRDRVVALLTVIGCFLRCAGISTTRNPT